MRKSNVRFDGKNYRKTRKTKRLEIKRRMQRARYNAIDE